MGDIIQNPCCAARFIRTPTWLIKRWGHYEVTLNAFLPKINDENNQYETSVQMHMSNNDLPWEEGEQFMSRRKANKGKPKPKLQGIADVSVSDVDKSGVKIDNLDGRVPFHANIVGWDNQEAEQKREAQRLADKATVFVIEQNIVEPLKIKEM